MDTIVRKKFVVVYLHTLTTKEQQPTVSFLKDIDSMVDSRYVAYSCKNILPGLARNLT